MEKYSLVLLGEYLLFDRSRVYKMLTLDDSGRVKKQPSLFDVIRIIVVLRPSVEQAYDLIARAGYCIEYDNSQEANIYRKIINNLDSGYIDDLNRLLESVNVPSNRKQISVHRVFKRLYQPK